MERKFKEISIAEDVINFKYTIELTSGDQDDYCIFFAKDLKQKYNISGEDLKKAAQSKNLGVYFSKESSDDPKSCTIVKEKANDPMFPDNFVTPN